jgi:guanylate kinase
MNKKSYEANYLFIYPPSFEELRRRIGIARKETEQEFKVRIKEAIKELEKANNSVLFTNRLVNDKESEAVDQFNTLIDALYFQEIQNARKAKAAAELAAEEKKE